MTEAEFAKLRALLDMCRDTSFEDVAFMFGYMAAKDVDAGIEAFCKLQEVKNP